MREERTRTRELVTQGHQVLVLTINTDPSLHGQHVDDGVHILTGAAHFPISDVITTPSLGTVRSVAHFLREHSIDMVSTHTRFFPMSYVGVRAAHMVGIPVIHTEHGSGFVASTSPHIAWGSRAVDQTMGRYVLSHADRVLAVSEQAAAFTQTLGSPRTDVFYNVIPPVTPSDTPIADRPEHLVFVGRMVDGKGWDSFLEAIARLTAAGQHVTTELLGDGAQLEDVRARVRDLGLDDLVQVRGRVTPQQVRESLRGATLVNPTVLSEGFQTTLLEALAERGRVVTYSVPGAALLAEQRMPVMVCDERTVDSLTDTVSTMLRSPPPADRFPDDRSVDVACPSASVRRYRSGSRLVGARGGATPPPRGGGGSFGPPPPPPFHCQIFPPISGKPPSVSLASVSQTPRRCRSYPRSDE